jgi:hypothetical protein
MSEPDQPDAPAALRATPRNEAEALTPDCPAGNFAVS